MKFNLLSKTSKSTNNHEAAKAYVLDAATELYTAVATTLLSDTFYESGNERLQHIQTLVAKNKPLFVAQLAAYARQNMNLRSVPMVLAVELAKIHSGDDLVGRLVQKIVLRADEITELLAYYQRTNGRLPNETKKLNKLSKQIQRGLASCFNAFDEYQFAKYNRPTEVKLRDALFLVHPTPKDEAQQALFNKIVANTLETPYTWETELSALGQQSFENEQARQQAFCTKWQELIDSGRLGYMALLRNLRNILEAGVSAQHIQKVCAQLGNEQAVAKARQMPFRFLAAYRELLNVQSVDTSAILTALEQAVNASAQNIQGFDAQTSLVIACDVSGSMQKTVSPKSKVMLYDIGLMLGMLLKSRSKRVITGMFGTEWKTINLPQSSVLSNVDAFYKREGEVGYATNGHLVLDDLVAKKQVIDKVMLFTDCQLWDSANGGASLQESWKEYKKRAPNAKLYLFDLAGYGTSPIRFPDKDVCLIAGWSDKVFDVLKALDEGHKALEEIEKIKL